jgi:hypothetical protein
LKHYRNQNYHAVLDRFAALDLLYWAKSSQIHSDISADKQWELVTPLKRVLSDYGIKISFEQEEILISRNTKTLKLYIYPTMKVKPIRTDTVFVSDFEVKYSRAYAVDTIRHALL